jgi:BASS family bile acid:Na+ symporter
LLSPSVWRCCGLAREFIVTLGLLLPVGLAFIMFSLGLGLRVDDFRRIVQRPRMVVVGLFAQVVLLPAIAFAIATLLSLDTELAVGLMILAACPGGVTAGMATRLAGGDTALSISLTALTSLLAFVSVPLIVSGALVHFAAQETAVRLPVGQLVGGLFMITLVPVTAGLLLRGRGVIGEAGRQGLHRLATMAFFAIVIATFIDQWTVLAASITQVGPAALLLNVATMLTGGGLAMAMRASAPVRIALVMECGLQNAALGITLAVSMLAMPTLAVPSVVYALLT